MTSEEKLEEYLKEIRNTIELCLMAGDFIGHVDIQVNIKYKEINNVNIGHKKSIRIQ